MNLKFLFLTIFLEIGLMAGAQQPVLIYQLIVTGNQLTQEKDGKIDGRIDTSDSGFLSPEGRFMMYNLGVAVSNKYKEFLPKKFS